MLPMGQRKNEIIPIKPEQDLFLVDCHAHFPDRNPYRKPTHSYESQHNNFFKKHNGQFIITSTSVYKDEHKYHQAFNEEHGGIHLTMAVLVPSDRYGMNEVMEEYPIVTEFLENQQEDYVGIGEFGLDFHRAKKLSTRRKQIEFFQKVIQDTEHLKKPYILHVRNATQRDLDHNNPNHEYNQRDFCNKAVTSILEEEGIEPERVQWHCFSGPQEWGVKLAKMGYYISIPSSAYGFRRWRRNISGVPLDKLLTETDSCFQHPFQMGGFNEPAFVKYSIAAIAYVNQIKQREVAEQVHKNAKGFFNI
jgi:TatD DNase family protein